MLRFVKVTICFVITEDIRQNPVAVNADNTKLDNTKPLPLSKPSSRLNDKANMAAKDISKPSDQSPCISVDQAASAVYEIHVAQLKYMDNNELLAIHPDQLFVIFAHPWP